MSDKQRNAQPAGRTGFSLSGLTPAQTKTDRLKPVLPVRCEDIESLAVLYACDELDAGARAELDAHAAACPACAAVLSREGRLQQAIASLEQPADSLDRSGLLLAQCRSQLAESLDDQQARANRSAWRSIFSPVAWWGASAPYADLSSGDEHDCSRGGGISRGRRGTEAARRSVRRRFRRAR